MFKINHLSVLTLCCTIVVIQCDSNASDVVHDGVAFEMIMSKLKLIEDRYNPKEEQMVKRSCSEVPSSGIYNIQPEKPFKDPITVFCDQEYESGGWIVIQHRFNGLTNFYRNWQEYKDGFGNLDGEFWLGLDRIYQLTVSRPHELVVLLEDFEDNKTFAKYDQFEIGDGNRKYEVTKLGRYSGTAGDSFSQTLGMSFSTFDSASDSTDIQCAEIQTGAWWYKNCHSSNLNGQYLGGETKKYATGIVWLRFRGNYYSLKSTTMMIRPTEVRFEPALNTEQDSTEFLDKSTNYTQTLHANRSTPHMAEVA